MKFVRRELGEAAEASNPGAPAMRREIVVLAVALLVLVAAVYASVGWIVELALPRISVARERAWFGAWKIPQPPAKPGDEAEAWARAEAVLERLRAQPGVPALDYRLHLLKDETPNAFAFPGGSIGVTRGLLRVCGDDEVALAFVLGHELGHFAHRDHLRAFGRVAGRAIAWAVIFGGEQDLFSAQATQLMELGHSRAQEEAADAFGLRLVQASYGRSEGAERLFRWLAERETTPAWAAWLRTHPMTSERVEKLQRAVRGGADVDRGR